MSEWISVKDALPKEDEEYICFVSNGSDEDFVTSFIFAGGEFGDEIHGNKFNKFITHWMPLPEPPK